MIQQCGQASLQKKLEYTHSLTWPLTSSIGHCSPGSDLSPCASVTVTATQHQWALSVAPMESPTSQPASLAAPNQWVKQFTLTETSCIMAALDTVGLWLNDVDIHAHTQCSSPSLDVCIHSGITTFLFLVFVSEPDQLYVYIQHQWGRRGFTGEVSQSRLSGGLPHLPMCYLCVQHDRSHGPDTLCHHPYQASRPAALHRLPTRGSCWHLWLRERQKPWNQSHSG